MALEKLPPLSAQLVEELDKAYPARCIERDQSEIDAHRYAAKRELVEFLMHLSNNPEQRVLPK